MEDWYSKDDYQLIITGDDRKQYFVDITTPVTIVGDSSPSTTPAAASGPVVKDQPTVVKAAPTGVPKSELDKQISS